MKQKIVTYQEQEQCCEECGEIATHCLTFLYEGGRSNPASSAYGKDDCTWCADETIFACDSHADKIRWHPPENMKWCSDFYRYTKDGTQTPHQHRYFKWKQIKEEIKED